MTHLIQGYEYRGLKNHERQETRALNRIIVTPCGTVQCGSWLGDSRANEFHGQNEQIKLGALVCHSGEKTAREIIPGYNGHPAVNSLEEPVSCVLNVMHVSNQGGYLVRDKRIQVYPGQLQLRKKE